MLQYVKKSLVLARTRKHDKTALLYLNNFGKLKFFCGPKCKVSRPTIFGPLSRLAYFFAKLSKAASRRKRGVAMRAITGNLMAQVVSRHPGSSGFIYLQGGPIKCYHFSIIHKFSNVNLFKIFIQRFVIRNIKPTFNINEFVKSELCKERNKDLCSVCV